MRVGSRLVLRLMSMEVRDVRNLEAFGPVLSLEGLRITVGWNEAKKDCFEMSLKVFVFPGLPAFSLNGLKECASRCFLRGEMHSVEIRYQIESSE